MTIDRFDKAFHLFMLLPVVVAFAIYLYLMSRQAPSRSFGVLLLCMGVLQVGHTIADVVMKLLGARYMTTMNIFFDVLIAVLLFTTAANRYSMASTKRPPEPPAPTP